jgi:hypothetical protein
MRDLREVRFTSFYRDDCAQRMKPADFLSDAYGMLQYCYQHDEWSYTEKALEAQLANDR